MDLKSTTDLLRYSDLEIEKVLAKSNKEAGTVGKDVEVMKNWMGQQKHLPFVFSDRQVFSFLNNSQFSLEKTKTCIDMYFTLKGEFPEFYSFGLNHPTLKAFQNNYNLFPLPKLNENQGRVVVFQAIDPSYCDCDVLYGVFCHVLEVLILEDVNSGLQIILDFMYASTEMIEKFTGEIITKYYFIFEKTYSSRSLSFHIITSANCGNFMETFRENSKPEMQNYIIAHESYESLMGYFSKDMLPKDYGGNLQSLKEFNDEWIKYFQEHRVNLEKHMNARTDESRRTFKIDEEVFDFLRKIGKQTIHI